jgi:hypothetical protein
MSNITNSRVFKRIGAGPYLKMLAERDANDKVAIVDSNRKNDKRFNSIFDNSSNCVEINNIVNTQSISNYYEYSVTKNDISNNKISFPRKFYLTGIDLIPILNTSNLNTNFDITIIIPNEINLQSLELAGDKFRYSVEKIKQFEEFTFVGNDVIDFKIIFKGFI